MLKSRMFKNIWHNSITSNMQFRDNITFRRVILVNTILFLTVAIFLFFAFYNYSIGQHSIALLDFIAGIVSLFSIVYLRMSKNIRTASKIATVNLALFFVLFINANESNHYGLIWTIFLPMLATLVNGRKLGLFFSLMFYSVIYTLAYRGIGVWAEGNWELLDFLRLFFSSVVLMYVMYFLEYAQEKTDKELTKVRHLEREHMQLLKELSVTDELTNLYNRRQFSTIMPKLLTLAQRKQLYVTFFIIDVDHFKPFNDNYGHLAGDEALKKVAHIIQQQIQRNDDFVFRLGGDEFAGVVLSDEPNTILKHIDSICKLVEKLEIPHAYSSIAEHITTSIGIAILHPNVSYSVDELYKSADISLYKAKEDGKNQCSCTHIKDENSQEYTTPLAVSVENC